MGVYGHVDRIGDTMPQVRVSQETHGLLKELSEAFDEPISQVVAEAAAALERERLLDGGNTAYARIKADPKRWAELQRERTVLDGALLDGLGGGSG